jgi:UDP-glucose 4-epimerase
MRCLVTGGTGMSGSRLVRLLLAKRCQVAMLVREPSLAWRIADLLPRLELIGGSLASLPEAAGAIQGFRPQTVFHLGWYGAVNSCRNDVRQVTENLGGTLELLHIARESGCQHFVGVGSQAEYGAHDGLLTEELPARPTTLYGLAKLCAGLVGQQLSDTLGIKFTWLRLLAAYGPADQADYLIPTVILSLLRGEKPLLTSGVQRWDYLYVEDVAEAIWQAAQEPKAVGVFNLASGQPVTVRAIVEQLSVLIDHRLPLGWGELSSPSLPIRSLEADISKFRRATGWGPRIPLEEGLRRTVEWFRENQGRYADADRAVKGAGAS